MAELKKLAADHHMVHSPSSSPSSITPSKGTSRQREAWRTGSARSQSLHAYTASGNNKRFIENGRRQIHAHDDASNESTISSCVASTSLKLEVEHLVHAQIEKLVKPLQDQLRGEVKKREEAEGKLRELRDMQERK